MDLKLSKSLAEGYSSQSQRVRVLSENWVGSNIYCPSCGNSELSHFKNNKPVADFYCQQCSLEYELKSKKDSLGIKVVDGAYGTMIERINSENNPSFFFLTYSSQNLIVEDFLVIPKHFFVNDIIEQRKPLSPNARRAGWIGCNLLLNNIPDYGKIFIIENGKVISQKTVLEKWSKTSFIARQKIESRGWTIEIMRIIDKIPVTKFSLSNVYSFEAELMRKFPNNRFVKDKIRQQLQVLRNKGLIEFNGKGNYTKI